MGQDPIADVPTPPIRAAVLTPQIRSLKIFPSTYAKRRG